MGQYRKMGQVLCCAPSSDLPGLKTGLPHLLTKSWSEDGVPVLRLGCPIFQPQVLPQLLTKLEDGADPTSDLPQLPTIKYHLQLFFLFQKIKIQIQVLFFKIIFFIVKSTNHTNLNTYKNIYINSSHLHQA